MDLLDMLMGGGDPDAVQRRQAAMLQNKGAFQQATTAANDRAQNYDILNFVAQNSNNPVLAKSIGAIQASQQQRNTPQKLDKGIFVPETGEYVESPGVADEKEADRQQRMLSAAATYQARTEAAAAAADARKYAAEQAREGRILRSTLAGQMTEYQRQRLEDSRTARDQREQDQADKRVTTFANTLEKAGVPEFEQSLQLAEGVLNKYKPGEIPGVGRLQGAVPNWALSAEAQGNRADMAQAANVLLKMRSGSAVTDNEMRRFLTEVGSGAGMDEATLRKGWANVRKSFDAKKSGLSAGVDDAVLDAYNARNPTITIGRGGKKPAAGPAIGTVQDGHVFLGGDPANPASWKKQ